MAITLSTIAIVFALITITFGYGVIPPSFRSCDPCRCDTCNDPAFPYCRAVGSAGAAVTLACFTAAELSQSPVSFYPICAPGTGDPVATASGAPLYCNTNSDCPTNFLCTAVPPYYNSRVCCKDPSQCEKFGNCPANPYCSWSCSTDSNCPNHQKCCGPYTNVFYCGSTTKYCENVLYTYSGK